MSRALSALWASAHPFSSVPFGSALVHSNGPAPNSLSQLEMESSLNPLLIKKRSILLTKFITLKSGVTFYLHFIAKVFSNRHLLKLQMLQVRSIGSFLFLCTMRTIGSNFCTLRTIAFIFSHSQEEKHTEFSFKLVYL